MATSEGIPSSIDIEFLELNDNPYNRESTKATKVDGSVVTWQKAVDAMNRALQNAGSKWRYELKGALPTLRKQ